MDWEATFRSHSPDVYQFLISLTGNAEEAKDLLQDTFIRAMRAEDSLRDPNKLHTWLMSIARNMFLDSKRAASRKKTSSLNDFQDSDRQFATDEANPEDHAHRKDFLSRLQAVMSRLSEAYRTAFTLAVIQKIPYREIEEITGWSLSKVKINVFRARQKVATALQEFQG